jgi:hypothetical protein
MWPIVLTGNGGQGDRPVAAIGIAISPKSATPKKCYPQKVLCIIDSVRHTEHSGFPGSVLFLRRITVSQFLGLGSRMCLFG